MIGLRSDELVEAWKAVLPLAGGGQLEWFFETEKDAADHLAGSGWIESGWTVSYDMVATKVWIR